MHSIFGEEFAHYEANVPLFLPRLSVWNQTDDKFDFSLYLQYREYRAAIGAVIALAALAIKAYFQGNL
jgi:hypothetical protein